MSPRAVALSLCLLLLGALAYAAPARDDLLAAINAGQARGGDFSGVQAAGIQVSGQDLTGINLAGADLRGASLTAVRLDDANLSRANLRGAILDSVSLRGADLSGCDFSGAILKLVALDGASLTETRFSGADLGLAMFSVGGGTHLPGLRLALQQLTGQEISQAWIAGLSGDAFAFCYNTENAAFWPSTPFTVGPLRAAPAAFGIEAKLHGEAFAQQTLMDDTVAPKTVRLLAVKAVDDQGLLQGRPLWAVLAGREIVTKDRAYFALNLPPFGLQTYAKKDLLSIWTGPWENLEPVGSLQVVRTPMLTLTLTGSLSSREAQARTALRQASQTLLDRRTYGPLVPGEAGLAKLAADLRSAGENHDLEAARRLAPWGDLPRQCLLSSRAEACAFLTEAATVLEGEAKQAAQTALATYQAALQPLEKQWPGLEVTGETMAPAAAQRYLQAADIIGNFSVAEHKVGETLQGIQ
ncbi:MAG: pentapeptide repeat-containing protein [Armatimonadota bacterium]